MSFEISLANEDVRFGASETLSILDAAQRGGIELPHACRQGLCGSCAGEIEQGTVRPLAGRSVHNEFCGPGQVLFCTCAPASDLVIRPRTWRRTDETGRKKLTAKVYRNTRIAPGVSVLQLRLPAGQRVKFNAGQYLRIELAPGVGRYFSMANPPHESDALTLHIGHMPGGIFSARLDTLCAGDALNVELPFGDFCVADDDRRPVVFVATGTGFAPIKSIIDDSLKRGLKRNMTLVWGARTADGLYMRTAVETWKRKSADFRFIPAISGGEQAQQEGMFRGRVDAALRASFPTLQGHMLYCCGSAGMIRSCFDAASRLGLAIEDFHSDAFVPAVPAVAPGQ